MQSRVVPIQNSGLSTSFPSQGKGPENEVAGLSVTSRITTLGYMQH